jgi:hypothetical protein
VVRIKPALAPTLKFFVVWAALNAVFNQRTPGREPAGWYFLPSLDVVGLFALLALAAWRRRGRPLPARLFGVLAALTVVIRVLRICDGVVGYYFWRTLNLYVDLPLAPEGLRLLRATVRPALLIGAAVLGLAALVGLGFFVRWALRYAAGYLSAPAHVAVFAGVVVLFAALTPLWPPSRKSESLHVGMFGTSVVTRLGREAIFLARAPAYRREKIDAMHAEAARIARTPGGMGKLRGADVLLIFVESYGATVLERPAYLRRLLPVYDRMERDLGARGFAVASGLLVSPTYGGSSWLAHATMATGLRAEDELEYTLVRTTRPRPKTMAQFFREAGYRTVLVQPATTRPWPEGVVDGFERKYYAADLDYHGPAFGWTTMPDQYVLDFVHRREVAPATGPLFVEYALVSSHAPWSDQAPIVPDWSRVGDGSIYRQLPRTTYRVGWSNLRDGSDAYISSIVYDLDLLTDYLSRFLSRDTLVIVLGDHQPVPDVTDDTPSHAVPIHLMSRNHALLDPFLARGYVRGMKPAAASGSTAGMETFLPNLLQDLAS